MSETEEEPKIIIDEDWKSQVQQEKEQAAQKQILEIPNGEQTLKVGVIDIPAFYIDFEAMGRDLRLGGASG